MSSQKMISDISDENQKRFSRDFLSKYLEPAFGSMNKAEIDLMVFSLLHQITDFRDKSAYDIARTLRITPTRVRSLKMQLGLRDTSRTEEALRLQIINLLSRCRYLKDGDTIQFGVEDPLVREDIANRLKKLDATADSSFNKELVRIQLDAFVDFISDIMPADQKKKVKQALVKAGMSDTSIRGILTGALKKLGEKVAGRVGEDTAKAITEATGPAIRALFDSTAEVITDRWKDIVRSGEGKTGHV